MVIKISTVRDIIWTIITVWIIYKIYEAFKAVSKVKSNPINNNQSNQKGKVTIQTTTNGQPKYDIKDAECVDYEEVK